MIVLGASDRRLPSWPRKPKRSAARVGIGVGLHEAYGAAQRLYVRRGYVPDGRGVACGGAAVPEGERVVMDDETILYLTKAL